MHANATFLQPGITAALKKLLLKSAIIRNCDQKIVLMVCDQVISW